MNWHPDWTSLTERDGEVIPADAFTAVNKYSLEDAVRFHRMLMDALPPLPSIVPNIALDAAGIGKYLTPANPMSIILGEG